MRQGGQTRFGEMGESGEMGSQMGLGESGETEGQVTLVVVR